MSRVVVVGSINHDVVIDVAALPTPGETVLAGGMSTAHGGKGANQAVAAARTAPDEVVVAMVGAVGEDAAGAAMRAALADAGADVSAVQVVDGPSGTAFITVDAAGENTIAVVAGANGVWPSGASDVVFTSTDVVVLQAEIPIEVIAAAMASARSVGATVVLNAAPALPELVGLLGHVSILIVNEPEAAELIGLRGADDAALLDAADAAGVGALVVTLGADGAVVVENDVVTRIPALPVDAVDTVGAGDAFVGALASQLASGATLVDAARVGAAAGALTVTVVGARHPELSLVRIR